MEDRFHLEAEPETIRCPRCRQADLQPTGGLSICPRCCLAITRQALRMELDRAAGPTAQAASGDCSKSPEE